MVTWPKLTPSEHNACFAIARRFLAMVARHWDPEAGALPSRLDIVMDLQAAHSRCPLDFGRLEAFEDFSFAHDVGGIVNHLDRSTGELRDCFVPRCAKPEVRAP